MQSERRPIPKSLGYTTNIYGNVLKGGNRVMEVKDEKNHEPLYRVELQSVDPNQPHILKLNQWEISTLAFTPDEIKLVRGTLPPSATTVEVDVEPSQTEKTPLVAHSVTDNATVDAPVASETLPVVKDEESIVQPEQLVTDDSVQSGDVVVEVVENQPVVTTEVVVAPVEPQIEMVTEAVQPVSEVVSEVPAQEEQPVEITQETPVEPVVEVVQPVKKSNGQKVRDMIVAGHTIEKIAEHHNVPVETIQRISEQP